MTAIIPVKNLDIEISRADDDEMAHTWDPVSYLRYADERGRPLLDLLARVAAESPRTVIDLGCGPGNLTAVLAQRWPTAVVQGLDSSAEMIARAEPAPRVSYAVGDLRTWRPEHPVDVVVANAVLQWVPGHLELLPALVSGVAPGGWLAFQVPGNFDEPSHAILRRLEADPRFAPHLEGVRGPAAFGPEVYLEGLLGLGCSVDAWETTYLHLLEGADPVFAWLSGAGARPTLQALHGDVRHEFEQEYRRELRAAYPAGEHGTVLPFRRVFVVARVGVA